MPNQALPEHIRYVAHTAPTITRENKAVELPRYADAKRLLEGAGYCLAADGICHPCKKMPEGERMCERYQELRDEGVL